MNTLFIYFIIYLLIDKLLLILFFIVVVLNQRHVYPVRDEYTFNVFVISIIIVVVFVQPEEHHIKPEPIT